MSIPLPISSKLVPIEYLTAIDESCHKLSAQNQKIATLAEKVAKASPSTSQSVANELAAHAKLIENEYHHLLSLFDKVIDSFDNAQKNGRVESHRMQKTRSELQIWRGGWQSRVIHEISTLRDIKGKLEKGVTIEERKQCAHRIRDINISSEDIPYISTILKVEKARLRFSIPQGMDTTIALTPLLVDRILLKSQEIDRAFSSLKTLNGEVSTLIETLKSSRIPNDPHFSKRLEEFAANFSKHRNAVINQIKEMIQDIRNFEDTDKIDSDDSTEIVETIVNWRGNWNPEMELLQKTLNRIFGDIKHTHYAEKEWQIYTAEWSSRLESVSIGLDDIPALSKNIKIKPMGLSAHQAASNHRVEGEGRPPPPRRPLSELPQGRRATPLIAELEAKLKQGKHKHRET